jgi:cGMP-dependent protein kinase 1
MSSGDIFGEGSLLTGSHRGVTAVALENSKLLSLDKAALVSVFGENFKEVIFKNIAKNSILSDTYLEFLSKENIITLVESLEWTQYSAGQVVIPEEYDKKSRFFVICSGEIVSTPSKHTIKSYSVVGLQNFNERSILQEQYIAEIDTIIGEINAASIEKMLNLAIDTIFQEADSIKILKNISIFKYLSLSKLKSLSSKLYLEEFEKKEIIFNFKESAKTLYIIKDGSVEIFNDGKVLRTLGKFDIFGERCLGETTRSASARASIRTECWVLDVEDLKALMEESITMEIERKKYYQADVMLNNLLFVQTIHKRSDRQMHITFYDRHNAYYNVQVISKSKFITIEQCMSLVQEKQINLQLDHHFIIKLVKTFTDQAQVYFVTEHIDGVILREIMKPILKENYINFLFSCIVTIIEYLHDKNIIYRDLCPENIMINRFGQPYLFNFSASKIVKGRTYTTIGNPYYRSPEIMIGRGYSKSTDYWSLGVILYEILYGYLPFDISYNDDPATSYEKIINNKVKFSTNPQYLLPNDLIQELLVDDTQRIQADGIKKHPWLSTIDWDMLSRPSSTSCFSPKIPILKLKPMSNMITLERYLNEELSLNQKTRDKKISNFAFRWEKYF